MGNTTTQCSFNHQAYLGGGAHCKHCIPRASLTGSEEDRVENHQTKEDSALLCPSRVRLLSQGSNATAGQRQGENRMNTAYQDRLAARRGWTVRVPMALDGQQCIRIPTHCIIALHFTFSFAFTFAFSPTFVSPGAEAFAEAFHGALAVGEVGPLHRMHALFPDSHPFLPPFCISITGQMALKLRTHRRCKVDEALTADMQTLMASKERAQDGQSSARCALHALMLWGSSSSNSGPASFRS